MLIRPVSDLHIDVSFDNNNLYKYRLPELPKDKDTVLAIAGDLCEMGDGSPYIGPWLRSVCSRFKAVVMVMGNHEHYFGAFGDAKRELRLQMTGVDNFHLLDNEVLAMDNVHFIGTTLWTNYYNSNPIELIKMQTFSDHLFIKEFPPQKAVEENSRAQEFLRREVGKIRANMKEGDKIYILTHHSPTVLSEDPRYAGSPISSAFTSALEELVYDLGADIWHHGHIHLFSDYELFKTRIICNAKGYEGVSGPEITYFRDTFVIEV